MAAKKRAAPKGQTARVKKAYLNDLDSLSKGLKTLQLHIKKHRQSLMGPHGFGPGAKS